MKRDGRLACGCGSVFSIAVAITPISAAEDTSLAFAVIVSLSAKAANRLAVLKEGITVSAAYFGEPTAAARKMADMGQISLGEEQVAIVGTGGPAFFSGTAIDRAKFALIKRREPMVNINVFSSRRSDPNNILACDIYEGAISTAVKTPSTLRCKLIGES